VQPVDLSTLLCPVASTLLLARERSLRTPQLRQLAFKKTRVGNLFSVRSRCELSEPNVQTDSREHVCDLDRLRNFASHHHEPSIGFTLKAKSLDRSLNLTVQAYADRPDVLYAEFVPFESNPVSVLGKRTELNLSADLKRGYRGSSPALTRRKKLEKALSSLRSVAWALQKLIAANHRLSSRSFLNQPCHILKHRSFWRASLKLTALCGRR
jgi:hypothetical protein